jgi:hypothetical protein
MKQPRASDCDNSSQCSSSQQSSACNSVEFLDSALFRSMHVTMALLVRIWLYLFRQLRHRPCDFAIQLTCSSRDHSAEPITSCYSSSGFVGRHCCSVDCWRTTISLACLSPVHFLPGLAPCDLGTSFAVVIRP